MWVNQSWIFLCQFCLCVLCIFHNVEALTPSGDLSIAERNKMPPTGAFCKGSVKHYMVESKLWDLSDDLKLDAIVKLVKGKKFTAGVSLISSCLNFLNHCIYIEACTSVGSTRGDK